MYDDYLKAYKLAQKRYKKDVSRGRYPYLPVLDEILSNTDTECEMNLGIMDIRLHQVVGTSTRGRTKAFAGNFMPLLPYGSEFSSKWSSLEDFQIEEGIHDEIKVYEYLNKYYVIEGNKRVSVLKFLNSTSITAEVIRKVPKKTDDPAIAVYYEYMDFFYKSKIHYIQFTKPGSYSQLSKAVGLEPDAEWSDLDREYFSSFYLNFWNAYVEKDGDRFPDLICGDAILFFLSLYPYNESKEYSSAEIKKILDKLWDEIILLSKPDKVELLMKPTDEKNIVTTVIKKIIPTKTKIAFIYEKTPTASDWTYSHELGRLWLNDNFGHAVITKSYIISESDKTAEEVIEEACEDGADVIFAITPQLINALLKSAITHPNIKMLNCSPNSSHNTVRTYYTRMYEAKFLTGLIAGAMCENDKIGYIADFPIYGVTANINAFALGAKMVNPKAKIYLSWSTVKQTDTEKLFWDEQINYISAQEMTAPEKDTRKFGLYTINNDVTTNLAMSIYHWGPFYEKLISSITDGTWGKDAEASDDKKKALNYWWGLSANVIDVICSNRVPIETRKLVHMAKKSIANGMFNPFAGPLYDQNGMQRAWETNLLSPEDVLTMDWLVDNVIGDIPLMEDLKDFAKPVVELRGLDKTTADRKGTSPL